MIRNALSLMLLSALGFGAGVRAAELSVDEQQIWDVVVACHDGWSESMEHQDYERFSRSCPQEPGTVWWYTGGAAPVEYGGPDGLWQAIAPGTKSATWSDLEPVEVQVVGDVGLVYFSVVWTVVDAAGESRRNASRRLTVLRRTGDRWTTVGGSVAASE